MVLKLTDANFKSTILQSDKVAIVRFWAIWSGPCVIMSRIFEGFSNGSENKAILGEMDVDENPETVRQYHINNVPIILFIKNGEVVAKFVGVLPKSDLTALLNKHL